jgi:hypothetical protein
MKKQQIIFRKELVHHQREIEETIGWKVAREMELKKEITHLRSMKNSPNPNKTQTCSIFWK